MLPGPRVFRNRWFALLWAGGMVWLAYDVASASAPAPATPAANAADMPRTDALGDAVTNQDLAALADAMSG